jgi:hypothetical protein
MIVVVDFDGTLALGNPSHITLAQPNYGLIERLKKLKEDTNPYIKIVTARGAKSYLSTKQKREKYEHLIRSFLETYSVPYNEISFTKEYGDLYIDDMTISQHDDFSSFISYYTNNPILLTEKSVIKKSKSSLFERNWYDIARLQGFNVPDVLFVNDETIITERIHDFRKPPVQVVVELLGMFRKKQIVNYPFHTYKERIPLDVNLSDKAREVVLNLKEHEGTFFHGDLSTTNILFLNNTPYLIDPNYKMVFGSYLTDAGKAFFSYWAYENDKRSARVISTTFGREVIEYAVCEGIRVSKYKPEFYKYVNEIADEL